MLRSLVRLSLEYRVAVVVASLLFVVAGTYRALRTPLDVFPEFAPPLVDVQVEAPGLDSESVEQLVTNRLENALNGVPRLTTMRSKSVQGLSQVQLLFEQGTDLYQARQMVTERVAVEATRLPQEALAPHVLPMLSSTSRVLKIGLTPKRGPDGRPLCTQTDVSVLMKWVIEPKLMAVPGVANVSTYGLLDKQFQIWVKPAELRARGVTLDQVKLAARQAVVRGSAGFHDTPNQRLAVQFATRINKPEDLASAVVALQGNPAAPGTNSATVVAAGLAAAPVLLGQVAKLEIGNPPLVGEGVVNDEAGLLAVVEKYPWANTLQVTRDVEAALDVLKPGLPNVDLTTRIFRPATFIELALSNLRHAMLLGCGLVALIVVAFLFDWRTAAISLTAIPLSIVAAIVALSALGATVNTMILAGLAIAVGEVVDDAIIDVENIVRRLRLNTQSSQPRPAFRVVLDASVEVRSAVVFATFIVTLVCMPVFFLPGVAGAFFRPLALAYVLAVLASLIVALTVTPAMALLLLPSVAGKHREPPLTWLVKAIYGRLFLPVALRVPILPLALLAGAVAGTVLLWPRLKQDFLPHFQETDFLMHWVAKPGTGIDVLRDDIKTVSRELRAETAVREFGSHIARAAERGEEVVGPNFAELWVSLVDDYGNYDAARKKIEDVMDRHPGFQHDLLTYLQERIKEVISGTGASIVVRIYGPDLPALRRQASAVRRAIEGQGGAAPVAGVIGLREYPQEPVPQLRVEFDPARLAAHGLTQRAAADALVTLINGTKVGEVLQDGRTFDVVVRGHPDLSKTESDLRELEIDRPGGQGTVRLKEIADLLQTQAPNTIRHDKASRFTEVTCNVSGDLGAVVTEIGQRTRDLAEEGYRIELLGEYQARQESERQLALVGALALVGIALLLYIDFRSLRLTMLVLFTLPFALVGGVLAAWLGGGTLSLGSLVGFVTVLGIAARNGIMMVSHYQHLREREGVPFGRELVLRGACERVAPVLMTALAAGLGLLPLALGGNRPGYEVEYPMAVVILGGLTTSTLLTLLILPVLYGWFGQKAVAK